MRTSPGVIPTARRYSSESLPCVVEAGWVTMVRLSPRFEVIVAIVSALPSYRAGPPLRPPAA